MKLKTHLRAAGFPGVARNLERLLLPVVRIERGVAVLVEDTDEGPVARLADSGRLIATSTGVEIPASLVPPGTARRGAPMRPVAVRLPEDLIGRLRRFDPRGNVSHAIRAICHAYLDVAEGER